MIKPAAVLLLLTALAVLGFLDRDGILARADVAARAVGVELRIDLTVQRVPVAPVAPVLPIAPSRAPTCPHVPAESRPCE